MIVLDANILLYAYDSVSPFHERAKAWFAKALSDEPAVGIPWQSVGAFLRIVTNPRIPGGNCSLEVAAGIVDEWRRRPNVLMLGPGERFWPLFRGMILEGRSNGPLMTDAQLAALTIENGGVLQTTDRDFARFPGLRWVNPIA